MQNIIEMTGLDHTHEAEAKSWVSSADQHREFPVQNLPLGIFSLPDGRPRIGCAIGDLVVDLSALAAAKLLPVGLAVLCGATSLNRLLGEGRQVRQRLRHTLFDLLTDPLKQGLVSPHLHDAADCRMHLPAQIGDYTDFYVGIHHATNIGKLLRPDNPLLPNYRHVPIGYHGRASSVRISGEPVRRPWGQTHAAGAVTPAFSPTERLDYELELGVWITGNNKQGAPVPIATAKDRFGGLCLLNDWSARDVQAWEYQPLGPFLSKNFHTTISPWIITPEALAPFRIAQQPRSQEDPRPLPYLWDAEDQALGAFSIRLEVQIRTPAMLAAGMAPFQLSHGRADAMYWTVAQMIAHHASNGCNLRAGDLLGTGTISGAERGSFGSLMELTSGGSEPLALPGGETRIFLRDGDEISLAAHAEIDGFRSIGFGQCTAIVMAAGE